MSGDLSSPGGATNGTPQVGNNLPSMVELLGLNARPTVHASSKRNDGAGCWVVQRDLHTLRRVSDQCTKALGQQGDVELLHRRERISEWLYRPSTIRKRVPAFRSCSHTQSRTGSAPPSGRPPYRAAIGPWWVRAWSRGVPVVRGWGVLRVTGADKTLHLFNGIRTLVALHPGS